MNDNRRFYLVVFRNSMTILGIIAISFFFYFLSINVLLFQTVVGVGTVTLGIVSGVVGFVASFRLKENILSKISPGLLIYTLLSFMHILTIPGMTIVRNVVPDFDIYIYLFGRMILAGALLIAVLDRRKHISTVAHIVTATVAGILVFLICMSGILPPAFVNQTPRLMILTMQIVSSLMYTVSLVLWVYWRKLHKDPELKPFTLSIILLLVSEIVFIPHYFLTNAVASIDPILRFIVLMQVVYLIFVVNLINPYNKVFDSLHKRYMIQKKLKNEIMINLQRLEDSQKIAHVGVWELDIEKNIVWASDEAVRIYGLDNDIGGNSFDFKKAQNIVLKEYRPLLDQALIDLIEYDKPYNVQFKILNSRNEMHHIHSQAKLEKRNGKPYRILGVLNDITDLKEEENKIRYISYHDHLTDIYNRRYFYEYIDTIDQEANYPIALAILDVNGLKVINDSLGHNVGNHVLTRVAEITKKFVEDKGIVARIGGDEFALIFLNTEKETLDSEMIELTESINTEKIGNVNLSVTYGNAIKESKAVSYEDVMKVAEDEMYVHKMAHSASYRNKIIDALLKTLYEKDNVSEEHSLRVSQYAVELAKAAKLTTRRINDINISGSLHDIGKITIPNEILNKIGKLDFDEYQIVKTHPERGYSIVHSIGDMDVIANCILEHHEYYNGKGYPKGLKGNEISLEARIITICDAYDAMTSYRTYKKNKTLEEAANELIANKGTQFDPELVDIFVKDVLKTSI